MSAFDLISITLLAGFVVYVIVANVRASRKPARDAFDLTQRCPACGYDLRATSERCPECGILVPRERRPLDPTKLRDDWPDAPIEPRVPGGGEALVVVWRAPHAMAAQLLVNQLAARGVPASVASTERPMQIGTYTSQGADHTVSVWSEDAERAEAILARFARDPA